VLMVNAKCLNTMIKTYVSDVGEILVGKKTAFGVSELERLGDTMIRENRGRRIRNRLFIHPIACSMNSTNLHWLVVKLSGRTSVCDPRTFSGLHQVCS